MEEKYLEDLNEIKDIMNRSTRFISLSGWSGVFTGITALAGALVAYQLFFSQGNYLVYDQLKLEPTQLGLFLLVSLGTLLVSAGVAIFFTTRNTRRKGERTWNFQVRRLLINLLIPLVSGGLLCLILLFQGFVGLLVPLSLIFYGLALVQASKFTLPELRSLGLIEILLGLIALQFISYSLWLWAVGFGLMHIVYGLLVEWKYRS